MRRLLFLVAVLACGCSAEPEPFVTIDAQTLNDEFVADVPPAEAKYGGRHVVVVGRLVQIASFSRTDKPRWYAAILRVNEHNEVQCNLAGLPPEKYSAYVRYEGSKEVAADPVVVSISGRVEA